MDQWYMFGWLYTYTMILMISNNDVIYHCSILLQRQTLLLMVILLLSGKHINDHANGTSNDRTNDNTIWILIDNTNRQIVLSDNILLIYNIIQPIYIYTTYNIYNHHGFWILSISCPPFIDFVPARWWRTPPRTSTDPCRKGSKNRPVRPTTLVELLRFGEWFGEMVQEKWERLKNWNHL
jgi:hypothetical protein